MKPQMKDVKRFLAGLDRQDLAEIRTYIDKLLEELKANNRIETAKRPHVAMPERRGGDRYELNFAGKCWDAMRESAKDREESPMRIIDISHTGCCLLSNAAFQAGTLLVLEFRAPSGIEKRILVEVARAQENTAYEGWSYEIGCRTVAEDHVEQAEQDISRQRAARKHLGFHPGIRVVLLVKGPGSTRAERWFKAEDYNLATVNTAENILPRVEEHRAHVVVSPLDALQKGKGKWARKLLENFPEAGLIVMVPSAKDRNRGRILPGADEVVAAPKIEEELPLAVERALFAKLMWHDRKMTKYSVKILAAGPEERQLRRLETLLLQEDYLVAKSLTHDDMFRQLETQRIDILIADIGMLERDGADQIARIREGRPQLVIVAETASPRLSEAVIERDADLILSPNASRSELLERLDEAYRTHLRRTFVK